jgi:hypothetical protein
MQPQYDEPLPATPEQIEELERLIARARAAGVRTGIRSDEIQDLTVSNAADLIEQLRERLGDQRR